MWGSNEIHVKGGLSVAGHSNGAHHQLAIPSNGPGSGSNQTDQQRLTPTTDRRLGSCRGGLGPTSETPVAAGQVSAQADHDQRVHAVESRQKRNARVSQDRLDD